VLPLAILPGGKGPPGGVGEGGKGKGGVREREVAI